MEVVSSYLIPKNWTRQEKIGKARIWTQGREIKRANESNLDWPDLILLFNKINVLDQIDAFNDNMKNHYS